MRKLEEIERRVKARGVRVFYIFFLGKECFIFDYIFFIILRKVKEGDASKNNKKINSFYQTRYLTIEVFYFPKHLMDFNDTGKLNVKSKKKTYFGYEIV